MSEYYRTDANGRALIPPGGTEDDAIMWCGEPEDFSFFRDLDPILTELNKLVDVKFTLELQLMSRGWSSLPTVELDKLKLAEEYAMKCEQHMEELEEENEELKCRLFTVEADLAEERGTK